MAGSAHRGIVYRFGVFEVFAESRELFRHGHRVKLQDQPFQLLLLLLENPGEIVSRESIQQHLWPENTFVEFGQSLGTAVTKLRQALGDDADNPRFVETIPRRGYRFIAPVSQPNNEIKSDPDPAAAAPQSPSDPPPTATTSDRRTASGERRSRLTDRRSTSRKSTVLAVVLSAIAVAIFAEVVTVQRYHRRNVFALAPKDTIILADFENTTGDAIFNDSLRPGLIVGLSQSPIIHVLSDRDSAIIFSQMGHAPDARMTGQTAIELCRRVGGKVMVQGSISSLGTAYLVGLAAIRCDTGKPLAYEQVEAPQRELVVDALGRATAKLRAQLGESLPSIQKYNAPLEQATTSSLEALHAYGTALSTWDAKGDLASLPFFKRAIEIDPNFAMAYGGLATVYNNIGETALATQNIINAYKLRERVTESERGSIDARYYLYVTGEVDKAASTYEGLARDYPASAGSFNHLATTEMKLGRNERAAEDLHKALQIDATRATTYGNLAVALLRLNKVQEAVSVLEIAAKRGLRTDYLLEVNYWVAFSRQDQKGMEQLLVQSTEIPGARSALLAEQASTEAYHGHFEKARSLSHSAIKLMMHDGDKESAANCLANAAIREAETGSSAKARLLIHQARKISDDKHTATLMALVSAETGDYKQALSLSDYLDKKYPHGTFLQSYWLPVIRAEVELRQGRGGKAVNLLAPAGPFESAATDEFPTTSLYPVFVRGQAYLSAGDGNKAAAEFQKIIDHPGMVLNLPVGALAYLGRARAYSLAGRSEQARAAYRDFLQLWNGADPNIPILHQAREEFARLNPPK
jgi:DNA-binding winged helix-turn-helix (wHTH) protein/tetratricopeptide (TPR) repeat protein